MDFGESTPKKKSKQSLNSTPIKQQNPLPIFSLDPIFPKTPQTLNPTNRRRSLRLSSTPQTPQQQQPVSPPACGRRGKSLNFTPKNGTNSAKRRKTKVDDLTPVSTPGLTESRRKRKCVERKNVGVEKRSVTRSCKKRVYYKKVVYDGGEFNVGDDVYVRRREDASSDDEDPEVEECRICYKPAGKVIMIECDECLGGFHLKCLKPPLKEVPEGDWICVYCEAKKLGKVVEMPAPPKGKKRVRTAKEKLLDSDLWAAHIERYMNLVFCY